MSYQAVAWQLGENNLAETEIITKIQQFNNNNKWDTELLNLNEHFVWNVKRLVIGKGYYKD